MKINRYTNFWIQVISEHQWHVVITYLQILYPEVDFSHWKYNPLVPYSIGYQDTPTYDITLSDKLGTKLRDNIITFREFVQDNLIDKKDNSGDKQHLQFIYNTLIGFYNESEDVDYMIKFKEIIDKLI